ncbi:EAL and modified HD-GYP domain-containing signal transduction protein [Gracilibacillus ureilyticus]|uniref:EAL and modified HD-GYP domain-containing signal transduction protein n=1 Tax=Gracilibacillus ureilyticus TaxID=531814 RepID=A0A1H9M824_9BACI|nr:HDOD domain-containing protein [Gracilibacillus ureilyticus]SER19619.1 EAL and modified HD-GYP domain-containing signal transduction protein [Gracilibacillus ureilyticus]
MSNVLLAKQPILSGDQTIYGYELLYRSQAAFDKFNGDLATVEVMINAFLNIGIDQLAGSNPVFINFTENLIHHDVISRFAPSDIVIELLEDIPLTEELKKRICSLSSDGYRIALDDVTPELFREWHEAEMIKYLTFIKIDFLSTSDKEERKMIAEMVRAHYPHVLLLAEKVETIEEFQEARHSGYHLFQGYFFMKPKVMETFEIPSYYLTYVQLIQQIEHRDFDLQKIAKIIQNDLSLSYKLLKLINSPAYRRNNRINSIERAVVLLGQTEIKKWLYVLALRDSMQHSQMQGIDALVKSSYYRAKMCENLAEVIAPQLSQEAFLIGYFSQLPVILRQPLERLIEALSLDELIETALKGKPSLLTDIYQLAVAYERVNWMKIDQLTDKLSLNNEKVYDAYHEANAWLLELFR